MLESPTAYLIDVRGWTRKRSAIFSGGIVIVLMIPAALTGATTFFGSGMAGLLGKNWFDLLFDSVSNIAMPLGGLGFALYCGWRLGETTRRAQCPEGFSWRLYRGWLLILRWLVPAAVLVVFLHAVGLV